jgi:hypothetical protein
MYHGNDVSRTGLGSGYNNSPTGYGTGYNSPHGSYRGDSSYGHGRDDYSYGGHGGYGTSGLPRSQRREFFINVVLDEQDLSHHATAAAQEHGQWRYGQAGAFLGGLLGTVTGGMAIPNSVIASEVINSVVNCTIHVMMQIGWHVKVTPIKLPPAPGQQEWLEYCPLGKGGHFMAFRVYIVSRVRGLSGHLGGQGCFSCGCFDDCVSLSAPVYNRHNSHEIEPHLRDALRMNRPPINAILEVADGEEEYHVISSKGWSRELAAQAVRMSRSELGLHEVPHTQMYSGATNYPPPRMHQGSYNSVGNGGDWGPRRNY